MAAGPTESPNDLTTAIVTFIDTQLARIRSTPKSEKETALENVKARITSEPSSCTINMPSGAKYRVTARYSYADILQMLEAACMINRKKGLFSRDTTTSKAELEKQNFYPILKDLAAVEAGEKEITIPTTGYCIKKGTALDLDGNILSEMSFTKGDETHIIKITKGEYDAISAAEATAAARAAEAAAAARAAEVAIAEATARRRAERVAAAVGAGSSATAGAGTGSGHGGAFLPAAKAAASGGPAASEPGVKNVRFG